MTILLVVVASWGVACKRKPAATGSVVFTSTPNGLAPDVFLSTQAETMRSRPLVRMALEGRGRIRGPGQNDAEIEAARERIAATRRGTTSIVDVQVTGADPRETTELCDAILETYLVGRRSEADSLLLSKMQSLDEERTRLDGGPGSSALADEIAKLEMQRRTMESDVRVLERCAMKR